MFWEGTYLSDRNHEENCFEYEPMRIGLAQKLYPYQDNRLAGVPLPSVLPTAQRGYELSRFALELSKQTGGDYDTLLQRLKTHSLDMSFPKVSRPTDNVVLGGGKRDQPSLLAVSYQPRQTDFSQLSRTAQVAPSGSVIAKSGSQLPPEPTGSMGGGGKGQDEDPDSVMDLKLEL